VPTGCCPRASAMTACPPAASSDAIRPRLSTRTAMGVPLAPNEAPVENSLSSNTLERNPIERREQVGVRKGSERLAQTGGLTPVVRFSALIH